MFFSYLILSVFWLVWCLLHSLLASAAVVRSAESSGGWLGRWYRLVYNGFAGISLLVPAGFLLGLQAHDAVLFVWDQWLIPVRFGLLGTALLLFLGGARTYDLWQFLGIAQLRHGHPPSPLLDHRGDFSRAGVSGLIRHPWYGGGILLVWSAPATMTRSMAITAAILSVYFLIGTVLEERKLVQRYPRAYRRYQVRVSRLFPGKWLAARLFNDTYQEKSHGD